MQSVAFGVEAKQTLMQEAEGPAIGVMCHLEALHAILFIALCGHARWTDDSAGFQNLAGVGVLDR